MYVVAVHGGAGRWPEAWERDAREGIGAALRKARALLEAGGSALDAVVGAVDVLEDLPVFNAGTGSVLNADGSIEMDAGVMDGENLQTGNVGALRRVRHPVEVARAVMERSAHVLLVGEGALTFARANGFADYDPETPSRREQWRQKRTGGPAPGQPPDGDTVGAVAVDNRGRCAAATSTGGTMMKLAGRVGDSPVPGAGNYADSGAAVSATGHGELMLRFLTAKAVCDAIATGATAQTAASAVLERMAGRVGGDLGIIAVDHRAGVGVAHGAPAMPHGWVDATGRYRVAMGVGRA